MYIWCAIGFFLIFISTYIKWRPLWNGMVWFHLDSSTADLTVWRISVHTTLWRILISISFYIGCKFLSVSLTQANILTWGSVSFQNTAYLPLRYKEQVTNFESSVSVVAWLYSRMLACELHSYAFLRIQSFVVCRPQQIFFHI